MRTIFKVFLVSLVMALSCSSRLAYASGNGVGHEGPGLGETTTGPSIEGTIIFSCDYHSDVQHEGSCRTKFDFVGECNKSVVGFSDYLDKVYPSGAGFPNQITEGGLLNFIVRNVPVQGDGIMQICSSSSADIIISKVRNLLIFDPIPPGQEPVPGDTVLAIADVVILFLKNK